MRRALHRLVTALAAVCLVCLVGSARAQCGGPVSGCRTCHELGGQGPFVASEPWHKDHALADFCSDCHGGSATLQDDSAHLGLVSPLADNARRCANCHRDRPDIAELYLAALVRPPAGATPSSVSPLSSAPSGRTPAANVRPPAPNVRPAPAQPGNTRNVVLFAIIVAIGLGAARSIVVHERARRALREKRAPSWRRPEWSAYSAGALLGLLVTVSMAVFGRRLSGSGAYQELAGPIGRAIDSDSTFFQYVIRPQEHWNTAVLVGAIAGSLASAGLARRFKLRLLPDTQWVEVFGPSVPKRWLLAFVGAALTALGAGIAGGCTASLALSGGAALSPGAFAFMAGMFAAGIPTARLIYRKVLR